MAYASRKFEWTTSTPHLLHSKMGGLALAMGAMACMGLAAYRMAYGDDHGHALLRHSRLKSAWGVGKKDRDNRQRRH